MPAQWMRLYARGFFFGSQPVGPLEEIEHFQRYDLPGGGLYADDIAEVGLARHQDDWLITVGKLLPLSTGIVQPGAAPVAEQLFTLLQRDGLAGGAAARHDLGGRSAILTRT